MNLLINMKNVLARPNDFYYDIQSPGRARWLDAVILIVLACLARLVSLLVTGYAFETSEPHEISYLFEVFWIIVPWLTWSVSNWAVSTIVDGEGKFKEIVVGSAYVLVPYIVFIIPLAALTNILSLEEGSTYSFLMNCVFVWVVLLIIIKIKTLHDFELSKVFWTTVLSIIGVFIAWFVGIVLFGLMDKFIGFIADLIKEINFRM